MITATNADIVDQPGHYRYERIYHLHFFKILVEKFEHFELTFFKQHVRQLLYPCVRDGRDHALLNQVLIAYPQLHHIYSVVIVLSGTYDQSS